MSLLLLLFLPLALSKITVYSPPQFRDEMEARHKDGSVPSTLAAFGNPPYGSRMIGKVYLPAHKSENKACDPLTPLELTDEDITGMETTTSPIVLVNRGKCPFAKKVRHAQDIGAKAVLIVDDQSNEENLDKALLFDDGSNGDIVIPSFLITKSDGEKIRQEAKSSDVTLILTFEVDGNRVEAVDVTLWMSSGSNDTLKFVADFADTVTMFEQGRIFFVPHYVLWYCTGCKASNYTSPSPNCLSGGRYCAPDPDGPGPLDGRKIVFEDLRQICVYQLTGDKGPKAWFSYVSAIFFRCYSSGLDPECAMDAMKGIVSAKDVQKCMNESFLGTDETVHDNELLRVEKSLWLKHGPSFFPSVQINNVTYKGEFHAKEVMKELCDAFSSPPDSCKELLPSTEESVSFLHMVLTILLILGILSGVLIVYRLWMRRELQGEMKRQVNAAVSQYVALNDDRKSRHP